MLSSMKSSWSPDISAVPHVSILEPKRLTIFINDPDNGIDCTLGRFVDDPKMGGVIDALVGCAAILRDLNRLEKWASRQQAGKQLCREGSSSPGGQDVECELAVGHCGKGRE